MSDPTSPNSASGLTRRAFLARAGTSAAMAAVAGASLPELLRAHSGVPGAPYRDGPATIVLFQGDSITDVSRNRTNVAPNSTPALGSGYPLLISAEVLRSKPDRQFQFFNRGISGNRVPDLATRWNDDAIALKPDVLSILIGVNDLWHKVMGRSNGTVEEYESGYNALLDQTRTALPKTRLVVLEPFVLRTGAVTDAWFPEFDQRREAAARVAKRANATFIPLHTMFDKLAQKSTPAYWAADGVHPTAAGHSAIAHAWLDAVKL